MSSSAFNFIWRNDPGLLRLKQATKALLAILLNIILFYSAPVITILNVCVAVILSMRACQGKTRQQQMLTYFIASIAVISAYAAGVCTQTHPFMLMEFLAGLGFLVFYLQRFGERFAVFPIFVWISGFLGTILPNALGVSLLLNAGAQAIACTIGFGLSFYLWPAQPKKIFYANLKKYFLTCQEVSLGLRKFYKYPRHKKRFLREKEVYLENLRLAVLLNQALYANFVTDTASVAEKIHHDYMLQFSIAKAFGMLLESTEKICLSKIVMPKAIGDLIVALLEFYLRWLKRMVKGKGQPLHIQVVDETFLQLRDGIEALLNNQPQDIKYFLNIQFSFYQLQKDLINLNLLQTHAEVGACN